MDPEAWHAVSEDLRLDLKQLGSDQIKYGQGGLVLDAVPLESAWRGGQVQYAVDEAGQ